MLSGLRRRTKLAETFELAPVVSELFVAAQDEAIAFRHDWIGTEHVLLALLGRDDETARALRGFGLTLVGVREDTRCIVGEGPAPEAVFDADALGTIGVDLQAVRQRVEATFGEGALERASRRRGSCGGAGFGVAPLLKRALESARHEAARRGTPLSAADVALAIAQQRGSVAGRILHGRAISPERLRAALGGRLDTLE
jgi:ATP-dependent Clp protease ATP-binding subunit ClpA